ncbi:hypothetical protein Tco_1014232 [Tanacetum coccineum]
MGFRSACKLLVLVVVLLVFVGDWDVVLGDSGKGVKDEKNLFGKPKLGFGYKKGFKRFGKGGGGSGLGGGAGGGSGLGGGAGGGGGLGGGAGGGGGLGGGSGGGGGTCGWRWTLVRWRCRCVGSGFGGGSGFGRVVACKVGEVLGGEEEAVLEEVVALVVLDFTVEEVVIRFL